MVGPRCDVIQSNFAVPVGLDLPLDRVQILVNSEVYEH